MASLKEVKRRINSVIGTMQVTSAMGSISAAKLHKTQLVIEHLLPYQQEMHKILSALLCSAEASVAGAAYTAERPLKKVAIVLVSSNRTFCGAFNSNVVKVLDNVAASYAAQGLSKDDLIVYGVGEKGAESARKAGYNVRKGYFRLADKQPYGEIAQFAQSLIQAYLSGEVDRIELVYNHYKSGTTQVPTRSLYLPFEMPVGASAVPDDVIIEPDPGKILVDLLPKVLVLNIYAVLLDAATAEHAARMLSMQQATDNADKLIQELRLQYNKQRQQAITNELLDIVAGTAN